MPIEKNKWIFARYQNSEFHSLLMKDIGFTETDHQWVAMLMVLICCFFDDSDISAFLTASVQAW